jgi:16S rRNA (uracil1498-N3)-methyltransferase
VERDDRTSLATFFAPAAAKTTDGRVALDEEAAHHARVRRLAIGERVRLTDGAGSLVLGEIVRLAKSALEIAVDPFSLERVERPSGVHLLVPVADRDRTLWLAEKCAELAVTSWIPVMYVRSRSVSPRAEGAAFREKVRRRMISALEQSAGAWLPEIHEEHSPGDASLLFAGIRRLLLDPDGEPALRALEANVAPIGDVAVALGPEGGFAPEERALLCDAGWRPCALAPTVLRFETAALAAVAVIRAVTTLDAR